MKSTTTLRAFLAALRERLLKPSPRALVLFLFAFSGVFFLRSYSGYFVCDDYEFLGRIDFHNAQQYFTRSWGYGNEYRPLTVYTYALDGALSGLSPVGYHLTNTLLHTGTAALAMLTLAECGFPLVLSALTGILFLINPVAHQSVLWIAARPVALSAFFMALGLWAFVKAARRPAESAWLWGLAYAAFVAALLSYESAVVFPALALLLAVALRRGRDRAVVRHLAFLSGVALVYVVVWNLFFHFRITRFPVETSVQGGLRSLAESLIHAFHGTHRTTPAAVYAVLLAVLALRREGRRLIALCAAWMLLAYLPFLLVRGYADRFSYISAVGAVVLLAAAARALWERNRCAGTAVTLALLCFFGIGMQHRITVWNQAGAIARRVVDDVVSARPELPRDATLVLLDVPDMHAHALVFMTGLERAVRLRYAQREAFSVTREMPAVAPAAVVLFRYDAGHMRELSAPGPSPSGH